MHLVTRERAAERITDDAFSPAEYPRPAHVPGSYLEAIDALAAAEARLRLTLRNQERMKAENERLQHSVASFARRAVAAQRAAHHDGLTGLPNRRFLIKRLQRAIAVAGKRRRQLALLFIDLDGFKSVNDGLGHAVADRLLAAVALRIAACVRTDDIACRYGGDEFVALLTNLGESSIVTGVVKKVREHIAEGYTIAGREIRISASIGSAVYPDQGDQWDALLAHADAAMYRDKAARSGRHVTLESQDALQAGAGRIHPVEEYR